jgi:hypothetical protein
VGTQRAERLGSEDNRSLECEPAEQRHRSCTAPTAIGRWRLRRGRSAKLSCESGHRRWLERRGDCGSRIATGICRQCRRSKHNGVDPGADKAVTGWPDSPTNDAHSNLVSASGHGAERGAANCGSGYTSADEHGDAAIAPTR